MIRHQLLSCLLGQVLFVQLYATDLSHFMQEATPLHRASRKEVALVTVLLEKLHNDTEVGKPLIFFMIGQAPVG